MNTCFLSSWRVLLFIASFLLLKTLAVSESVFSVVLRAYKPYYSRRLFNYPGECCRMWNKLKVEMERFTTLGCQLTDLKRYENYNFRELYFVSLCFVSSSHSMVFYWPQNESWYCMQIILDCRLRITLAFFTPLYQ